MTDVDGSCSAITDSADVSKLSTRTVVADVDYWSIGTAPAFGIDGFGSSLTSDGANL